MKMKTPEEINALKAEFAELHRKPAELTEEEMKQITGGGSKGEIYIHPPIKGRTLNSGITLIKEESYNSDPGTSGWNGNENLPG